jgi:hypothetical protein
LSLIIRQDEVEIPVDIDVGERECPRWGGVDQWLSEQLPRTVVGEDHGVSECPHNDIAITITIEIPDRDDRCVHSK